MLEGTQSQKKQIDFAYYNQLKDEIANFDWRSAFVAKEKDDR